MQLDSAFVRLPYKFDAGRLADEVAAVEEDEWRAHPQDFVGNTSLPLVAVHGDPDDEAARGTMAPTPVLERLPYLRQVLVALDAPIGRSRLMRIDGRSSVSPHVDTNYYWHDRLRVHVPIVTTPGVQFLCGGESVHMAAGECWVFDTTRLHDVVNPADTLRIHLVTDTVGSPELWEAIDAGNSGRDPLHVPFDLSADVWPVTEQVNVPVVMHPTELTHLAQRLMIDIRSVDSNDRASVEVLDVEVRRYLRAWRALWAQFGDRPEGWAAFEAERKRMLGAIERTRGTLATSNGTGSSDPMAHQLVHAALNTDLAHESIPPGRSRVVRRATTIERPVIVISPPRAGSSLLFETLARSPSLVSIDGESHALIESINGLAPAARDFESNRLDEIDASPEVVEQIHAAFLAKARHRDGRPLASHEGAVRLLEKTPKNALRIPFLDRVFPDAAFVYLYRDPRDEISSMLDAWRSGRFVTYPELAGWDGPPWSLLLVPGWRDLNGRSLAEVVAMQWAITTSTLLDDLDRLDPERWCVASYSRLVDEPAAEIARLCGFLDIEWDTDIGPQLPLARHTLTPPDPDKWRKNEAELKPALEGVAAVSARARDVFGEVTRYPRRGATAPSRRDSGPAPTPLPSQPNTFDSVHTSSVPELLTKAGASILVSTYQSGRLITLRVRDGVLNTHFVALPRPMGIALGPMGRLAVGTSNEVLEYRDQPAAGRRLDDRDLLDACYLPRSRHTTGDISIHDMAYGDEGLWVVNTRFSCLATLDADHSFVPRWRPPFVSGYAAEDRCHLNGMAMVHGRPKWVTALGVTDVSGGWRDTKAAGGVVIDVDSSEVVAEGLSMPHSPRWSDGRLWVLESGRGTLATVDVSTGSITTVAELPGFTRGLTFIGPYALVGLSQVRESVFGGLPLTERDGPRFCGVWVVDARSGDVVGFVRFEGIVQEIYDVQVLGRRFPEICELGTELASTSFVLPDEAMADVAVAASK